MFKRCKVVMLPTNQKADHYLYLYKYKNKDTLYYNTAKNLYNSKQDVKHHLYILSDDEIKEDEWIYNSVSTHISTDSHIYRATKYDIHNSNSHKIIATTDSSLRIEIDDFDFGANQGGKRDINLPSPSQSFIEKYVEEYNKGNKIKEVMVEYVDNGYEVDMESIGGSDVGWFEKLEPKINSKDNTITIRKIKDSWTKEKVVKLLYKGISQAVNNRDSFVTGINPRTLSDNLFNEWIDKNL